MITIHRIVNHPITSNCYIVSEKAKGNSCLLVDPGSETINCFVSYINSEGLIPEYILLTHEHCDHVRGVNKLRERYQQIKVVTSKKCSKNMMNAKWNLSAFLYPEKEFAVDCPADIFIEDITDGILWQNHLIKFRLTPGHTVSSVSILLENIVFTGDSLLKNTPTFTNLPSGNKEQQKLTEEYLYSLIGFMAMPGHGDGFVIK